MSAIKISFVGDFVSSSPDKAYFGESVREIIKRADIRYINFEAPCSDGRETAISKSGPSLYQPVESIKVINDLGFNVISLANNHILDYGVAAAQKTYDLFRNSTVIGFGDEHKVYKPQYIECKGVTIGFISGCQREFGALDSNCDISYGYAWINDDRFNQAIIEAKKNCDYLFVCPHAGVENIEIPIPEWRHRYRELIDLGADAVIASHPHIIQGFEEYNGKRIYYSLGNFFFDRPSMPNCWHHGLIVTASIEANSILYEHNYVRLNNTSLLIDETCTDSLNRLNKLLAQPDYDNTLNGIVNAMTSYYDGYLSIANSSPLGQKGIRKFLSWCRRAIKGYRDDLRLVNLLRCESHRWLYIRCLNNRCRNKY